MTATTLDSPLRTLHPRLAWWRRARVGMFIHWGPYSALGGTYDGRRSRGCGEWIRRDLAIPREDYARFALAWQPQHYDPAAWVALAQEAGLGYLVMTSKHHDGFCMWNSAHTDFSIARGACGRDVMGELRRAADAAGLRLGWYYSPRDWHHPDFRGFNGHPDLAADPGREERAVLARYIDYVRDQTLELIDRYGPVATLWYDGQDHGPAAARTDELLAAIRARDPSILVNDRIGLDGYEADYAICEGFVPGEGPARPWETCLSLNYTWGYRADDQRWCPPGELIRKVCDSLGLGGNFLVNVGPDGDGRIPAPAQATLRAFGAWMRVHGEALCSGEALPPPAESIRLLASEDALTALLLDPVEGEVLLPRVIAGAVPRLVGGRELPWKQTGAGVRLTLPKTADGLPRIILLPNANLLA